MKRKKSIFLTKRICLLATTRLAHVLVARAIGILGLTLSLGTVASAQTILGTTGSYAVMAGSTVTINGAALTSITGGLAAAGTIAGSQATTYQLNGSTGPSTPGAMTGQNQTDFTKAFAGLAAMTPTTTLTSANLGGQTLLPGIYNFSSSAVSLTGTLTLNANNQSNAVWVFQIGTTFDTTASNANVVFTNLAANSVANDGLFWRIGGATTIGAGAVLEGNFLGGGAFSVGTGATINDGRMFAGTTGATGTITLSDNTINFIGATSGYSGGLMYDTNGTSLVAVPEPATTALIAAVGALGLAFWHRRRATS